MTITIRKDTPTEEVMQIAAPCGCEACRHGCTMGSGVLADGDKKKLAKHLGMAEEELEKEYLEEVELFNKTRFRPRLLREHSKPYGRCVFYDEQKGCTVHDAKPLQCRTAMGCGEHGESLAAWFAVNHLVDTKDAQSIREYEAALKGGMKQIPGAKVEDLVPNKERLEDIRNFKER